MPDKNILFKNRLKKIATKKFRTCFISAISQFESAFGVKLWGHGLDEKDCTADQLAQREVWELVRKKILDSGNTQARGLCSEIDLHDISFEGYKLQIKRKSNGQ